MASVVPSLRDKAGRGLCAKWSRNVVDWTCSHIAMSASSRSSLVALLSCAISLQSAALKAGELGAAKLRARRRNGVSNSSIVVRRFPSPVKGPDVRNFIWRPYRPRVQGNQARNGGAACKRRRTVRFLRRAFASENARRVRAARRTSRWRRDARLRNRYPTPRQARGHRPDRGPTRSASA